jgi:3-oxoacyl-[acyl-carrier-protein] synthase-1
MRACIVALGARTSVGRTAPTSAAAVLAGITSLSDHPTMVDGAGDPFRLCMDPTLVARDRPARLLELAASALDEVIAPLPRAPTTSLPILLALPEPSEHLPPIAVDRLCQQLAGPLAQRFQPRVLAIQEGNAAGMVALERAITAITDGTTECCIVGGVDSWIDADLLDRLDAGGRTLSVTHRWGFPPGEGAAMLAVCTPVYARRFGLPIRAWIASVVTDHEPKRMHTETINLGEALARVLAKSSAAAGTSITKQYCDLDGERYLEHEFSYAILRVPAPAFLNSVDYVAPADCWGNVGAATATMLTTLPILHHERGFSPGAWPMVWCGSEGGRRGAAVLHLEPRSQ